MRDIFGEERGLIAHGPGIPGRFLLDDGANQRGVERLRGGGFARERDELRRGIHSSVQSWRQFRLGDRFVVAIVQSWRRWACRSTKRTRGGSCRSIPCPCAISRSPE